MKKLNLEEIKRLMNASHWWINTQEDEDFCSKCEMSFGEFHRVPHFCDEGGKDFSGNSYFIRIPDATAIDSIRSIVLFYEMWLWNIQRYLDKASFDKQLEKIAMSDYVPKNITDPNWQKGYQYGLDTLKKILDLEDMPLRSVPNKVLNQIWTDEVVKKEDYLKEQKQ